MSQLKVRSTKVNGHSCRIWEKGDGEPLTFLAGFGGLSHWPEGLDLLAKKRRVVVPSLPGFPGADGHHELDSHLDWVTATLDLLEGAGCKGSDLMGVSVGGTLAAEAAAFNPALAKKLILVSPLGLFDQKDQPADVFTALPPQVAALMCEEPSRFSAIQQKPDDVERGEWEIVRARAHESAARLLWPLGNTGLIKRLHRIHQKTLIVWGEKDQVIPPSYAQRFSNGISGETKIVTLPGAGHLANLDKPEAVSEAVLEFLD